MVQEEVGGGTSVKDDGPLGAAGRGKDIVRGGRRDVAVLCDKGLSGDRPKVQGGRGYLVVDCKVDCRFRSAHAGATRIARTFLGSIILVTIEPISITQFGDDRHPRP